MSRPPTRSSHSRSSRFSNSRPNTTSNSENNQQNSNNNSNQQNDWIISILEGRGIGREIGVVAIEKEIGKVVITQFPDTPTYVKSLHLFTTRPPALILVPNSSLANLSKSQVQLQTQQFQPDINRYQSEPNNQGEEEESHTVGIGAKGESSLLVRSLKDAWPGIPIIGVARKYWNEQQGYEFLTQLILQDTQRTAALTAVKSKYFALSSACALFKYLESTHSLIFPPRSLRVEYQALEGTCWIDRDSVEELELVSNITNKNSKQHLLGLLNHCHTPMAARLLRTNILSPLTETKTIDDRLDVVEELVASEERFNTIRKSLEPLKNLDLDKLIYQIISSRPRLPSSNTDPSKESELKISRILQLRTFLNALPSLRSALQGTTNSLLSTIRTILNDDRTSAMLKEINETFNEDAILTLQKTSSLITRNTRIYAIRAEKKLLLDVARETFKEGMNDAYLLCESMKDRLGVEIGLVFGNNGFVFSVTKEELTNCGKDLFSGSGSREFINVNKKGKKFEFSTLELKKRNARIMESVQEIFLMSDDILDELLAKIRDGIACLYRSTEAIAMLDMLASFADVANRNNYVRPEWTDTLAIKAGRHPLHEQFRLSDGAFVPNDTYANDAASFQIVGGSNMSGKSTLLRQIALLYIMAQIGCYVPAQYASFRVIDALFTRLSNDDSIEASLSTFSKEMQTMAMILSAMKLCNRCLIIVDELGRGTSPAEGVGIAHAIAERIIEAKALCFFATHFKELSITLGRYPNVVSLHLETEIDRSQSEYSMTFHHRVLDGNSPLTHYGLELAKLAKLPTDVLEKAEQVSYSLESLAEEGRLKARSTQLSIRRKGLLRLKTQIQELSTSRGISSENLLDTLRRLQKNGIKMLLSTLEVEVGKVPIDHTLEVAVSAEDQDTKENYLIPDDSDPSTSPTPVGTSYSLDVESNRKSATFGIKDSTMNGAESDSNSDDEVEMMLVKKEDEEDSTMMGMDISEVSMDEREDELREEGDETLEF